MTMILILDNSAAMILSLSGILTKAGYEVETAGNGKEGIDKLSSGLKPAVILTDLNMPEMDGIQFIKEARKSTATKFTPIIVLSGDADGRKRDDARSAGASGWLTKPLRPNQLLYIVKQLVAAV